MDNFIFCSDRLGFRHWQADDIPVFGSINADPVVMEYLPKTLSKLETREFANRIQTHFSDYGYGLYATELLESGDFTGYIGFQQVRFQSFFTPAVEIGYRLNSTHWGRGLATEGAQRCLEYGFQALDLEEIVSFTAIVNDRSEKVMKKIGMRKSGEFDHPSLPESHPLRRHVLYKIQRPV